MYSVENITLEDVEIQPHYRSMDIELTATYEEVFSNCTSEVGNQSVTENWTEYELYDFTINKVGYTIEHSDELGEYAPSKYIQLPNDLLTKRDVEVIRQMIPHYEP